MIPPELDTLSQQDVESVKKLLTEVLGKAENWVHCGRGDSEDMKGLHPPKVTIDTRFSTGRLR